MRLLTDSVEADEGYVSTQQQQQQQIRKPNNNKQNLQRRQPQTQKMNSIHSSESLSSDESSMSSSPSPADYVFDIMYHDQQGSLSMLDIKDPFYEPFFGSLDNTNNPNYLNETASVGGMTSSFSLSNIANATTTDVLQQLFPNQQDNVELIDQPMNDYLIKQQKKQLKKSNNITKKYNKKQKNIKNSSSSINMILSSNSLMNSTPSSVWIDPSIYPLWPNYICLYLEYSLPYDPSVSIHTQIQH